MMQNRPLLPYFLLPAFFLLVPWIAMHFTSEMNWTAFDFVAAYVLLAGAGFAYRFMTTRGGNLAYRAASAVAVIAGVLLIWVNLAVGFFGNEENPINLLFGAVLLTVVAGASVARLKPGGLSRALFATAAVQFVVPILAFLIRRPPFDSGVVALFLLNGIWVFLFALSGLLFRHAATTPPP